MNNNIKETAPRLKNPWSKKENLPSLNLLFVIWTVLLTLVCSVYPYIAAMYPKYAPYAMCAIGLISVLFFYRSTPGKLLFLSFVALFVFFFGSPIIASFAVALVLPTALGSVMLAISAKKHPRLSLLLLLLPSASFGIAYFLTGSIPLTLISLIVYPPAVLLAFALVNDSSRVGAICHASVGFLAFAILIIGVTVFYKYGEFSSETLKLAIDDALKFCTDATHRLFAENEELLKPIYEAAEISSYREIIDVEELLGALFGYIPAAIVIICNALGFISQSGQLNVLDGLVGSEKHPLKTLKSSRFVMSATAAVVFLLSGLLQFIASCSGAATFSLICETMFLILLPGFCLSGFGSLLAKLMVSKAKNKALIIVLIILFASCMLYAALTILAISGAFNTISYHLFLKNFNRPNNFKK
jgi:hypothetical protein